MIPNTWGALLGHLGHVHHAAPPVVGHQEELLCVLQGDGAAALLGGGDTRRGGGAGGVRGAVRNRSEVCSLISFHTKCNRVIWRNAIKTKFRIILIMMTTGSIEHQFNKPFEGSCLWTHLILSLLYPGCCTRLSLSVLLPGSLTSTGAGARAAFWWNTSGN